VLACFGRVLEKLIWSEEIGTNLKGMGIGTFFIAHHYCIFVKNKTELVTFRIV
jgi:Tfp pilus assembly protein PilZ